MEVGSEPSASTGLLSSGTRSVLNPAVPLLPPSDASLTTGPTHGNHKIEEGICILAHKKTYPLTYTQLKAQRLGIHTVIHRDSDFPFCPKSVVVHRKSKKTQTCLLSVCGIGHEKVH